MPRKGKVESSPVEQVGLAVEEAVQQQDAGVELPDSGLVEALQGGAFDAPRHDPDTGEILVEDCTITGQTSGIETGDAPLANQHLELGALTLSGDLRDEFLRRLRVEQNRKPWDERSEREQEWTASEVDTFCKKMLRQAVELITASIASPIPARVESVAIKDEVKAVLTMSKSDPGRFGLFDAQGKTVMLTVADPTVFYGERAPVHISKDQRDLPIDSAVVHSAGDGAKEDETPAEEPEPAMELPPGAVTNGSGAHAEHAAG